MTSNDKDQNLLTAWSRQLQSELADHAASPLDAEILNDLQFDFILRIVREYVPFIPTYEVLELSDDVGGREQLDLVKGSFAMSDRRLFARDEAGSRLRTVFEVTVGQKSIEDFVCDPRDGSAIFLHCDMRDPLGSQIKRVSTDGEVTVLIGGLPYLSNLAITPSGDQLIATCSRDGRIFRWRRDATGRWEDSYPRSSFFGGLQSAGNLCASEDSVFVTGEKSSFYRISLETGSVVCCVKSLGPFFGLHYCAELDVLVYLDDDTLYYIPTDDLKAETEEAPTPNEFARLPEKVCDLGWYRLSDLSKKGEFTLSGSCGLRSNSLVRVRF